MLRILGLLEARETQLIPCLALISDALRWFLHWQADAAIELYLQYPERSPAETAKLLVRLVADGVDYPLPPHLQQVIVRETIGVSSQNISNRHDYVIPIELWRKPTEDQIQLIGHIFTELSRDELFEALKSEKAKAEALLHNMLPDVIVERIKGEEGTIYDYHPSATILFSDMVGFTEIASHMDAHRVVSLIDHIFRCFDELCDQRGVEKIKTIGDSYMAAAGVPLATEDHAERIADLALDMLATHRQVVIEEGVSMDIRIGIHTGPVVAGVIGHRKYAYDLWGDSVNVASRMESTGIPGEIQLSIETQRLLPPRFRCDIRGNVALKGHGSIEAFLLRGRSNDSAQPSKNEERRRWQRRHGT
ncbi:adenylate/guanylate cyclase domain-containing protein [Cyanobium sp. T1G-Tous]|uniref:adenylate/guanylate cyclase domain-containing protein n=1 Tax=Cyanobium sp. T1G-Tous TaxID=2823722 RepID=UPI0020CEAD88|nr:adenylate/guanylate cyclase domain-containing protein [Cyanobium sp. T1G-Tous]